MNWTQQQLETFAKAGGWSFAMMGHGYWHRCLDACGRDCNGHGTGKLPDFPNDLQACFDVLDMIRNTKTDSGSALGSYDVGKSEHLVTSYCRLSKWIHNGVLSHYCAVFEQGKTLQDAIIAVVLKAVTP